MLIKSFLSEQAKYARYSAKSQHQDALDLEEQAQTLRKRAANNEAMAEELERLAAQYPDEKPEQTPGAAGREVQHVDAPVEDDKIRYVWLTTAECTADQRGMCVGIDDTGPVPKYAIDWEQLTADQQTRFADRVSEL